MATSKSSKYGWIRQLPDARDCKFKAGPQAALPPTVNLQPMVQTVFDQGQEGCHDDKTEVLTETGWQLWSSYNGEDLLGTMNPLSRHLEFQSPTELHVYDYDGPMYVIDHKSIDFSLTPGHRMFLRKWDERNRTLNRDYQFEKVSDLGWYAGLPSATLGWAGVHLDRISIGGRNFSGDDFLSLVALVCSDGWAGGTHNNWNRVSFCCFREDRIAMVRSLARRLGIEELPGRPGVWHINDEDLAHWFRCNIFTGSVFRSLFKKIPSIVKEASQPQIAGFLEFFGDQHVNAEGRRSFYSGSQRMISDLQELLLRVGKRSGISERDPRESKLKDGRVIHPGEGAKDITLNEWRSESLSIDRKRQMGMVDYKGQVFCASVPNSTLVTRRNGSILISGNSCTANAICQAMMVGRTIENESQVILSRNFLYYNERVIEGDPESDNGATIRDGMKSAARTGVCPESLWPYLQSDMFVAPPRFTYIAAKQFIIQQYMAVQQNLDDMRACLSMGYPFVFGFSVYDSFESIDGMDKVGKYGNAPMPNLETESVIGGHAVCCVGYNDGPRITLPNSHGWPSHSFLVQNSWGSSDWGLRRSAPGCFTIPYAYLANPNLASDFWTIRLVS